MVYDNTTPRPQALTAAFLLEIRQVGESSFSLPRNRGVPPSPTHPRHAFVAPSFSVPSPSFLRPSFLCVCVTPVRDGRVGRRRKPACVRPVYAFVFQVVRGFAVAAAVAAATADTTPDKITDGIPMEVPFPLAVFAEHGEHVLFLLYAEVQYIGNTNK